MARHIWIWFVSYAAAFVLGGSGVDKSLEVREPHADASGAQLDYGELIPLVAAPERIRAHTCKVCSLWKADNLIGEERIWRQLARRYGRHFIGRPDCCAHDNAGRIKRTLAE